MGVKNSYLRGSSINTPLFRALNIPVPDILLEDYSEAIIPYPYQILSKIPGDDLGKVIMDLSEEKLSQIAAEITSIIKKLATLPTTREFGCVRIPASTMYPSWTACLRARISKAIEKSEILRPELIEKIITICEQKTEYLNSVESIFFYEDMGAKNILVNDGRFSGIVDLDFISYGDPLDALGSILATWPEKKSGKFYLSSLCSHLNLSREQKNMVVLYAAIHRFFWLSELADHEDAEKQIVLIHKLLLEPEIFIP